MLVAYDGTRFKGFAAQPGQRTVAGELAAAIGRVVQHPVETTCAGRTDRGVHAWGQVIHVDVQPPEGGIDLDALARSCRKQLGPEIVVRAAALAEEGFDARRSATRRRYRYTILNRPVPDPFMTRFAWHVEAPLDEGVLREIEQVPGVAVVVGEHSSDWHYAGGPIAIHAVDARFFLDSRFER